ncbi:MAG TPA: acyl-CoA synthetase [Acidimicrobiia bacterium]|nr:acyl-CoA synthetase [Acidimicrobiia bacterium]
MEYNLADLFEKVVDTVPEREALVYGDRRLTFTQVEDRANRLAHALADLGVGAGDHVALYLRNGTEYLEGMLAAFKLRAVPVNVNYRYVEDELRYLLDNSDAEAVVFDREFAPKLAHLRTDLPGLVGHLAVAPLADPHADDAAVDPTVGDAISALGAVDYEDALAGASPARDFGPRSADDLYILYTGGTTGMPKGVMWRHEDIFFGAFGGGGVGDPISSPDEIAARAEAGTTRCFPACPFMHGTAHWMAFQSLLTGGAVVIDTEHHLDPTHVWELVAREHVNFLVIVGDAMGRPLVEAIEHLDPEVDLSGLTILLSGGAILSPPVKRQLAARLPSTMVIDGIGSSEAGGQGQMLATKDGEIPSQPRFAMGPQNTVLDDHLRPAAPGEVGKLARSGHIPLGYYKDEEKSAATFPVVDGVRWSIPGDHARIESDGTITVLGRGSVSINTGGEKVYPEEVEGALKSHDDVFDAVVVGVPDQRWGERVVAVVQPRGGATPTLADLDGHVREHIAGYKAPRDLVLVDAVVRSPSGKPDYRWAKTVAMQHVLPRDPDAVPAP